MNSRECFFDGGDCCKKSEFVLCTDCYCLKDDGSVLSKQSNEIIAKSACINEWLHDGVCDERNNIEGCSFDEGDCCNGIESLKVNCADCRCKNASHSNYEGIEPTTLDTTQATTQCSGQECIQNST